MLPFLDSVDESMLILRSGEYDLVENESDLKNVLGKVLNVEGDPDMVGLCTFNLPPGVLFEALLPRVDTDPSEDDPINDAEEVLLCIPGCSERCSLLSLFIASLLALSKADKFLKLKDPNSVCESFNLLDLRSLICGGIANDIFFGLGEFLVLVIVAPVPLGVVYPAS